MRNEILFVTLGLVAFWVLALFLRQEDSQDIATLHEVLRRCSPIAGAGIGAGYQH
jgi:hypothetical protein